jgi:hypothetical protein
MVTAVIVLSTVTLVSLLIGVGAVAFAYRTSKGASTQVIQLTGRNAELGMVAIALLQLLDQLGMDRIEHDSGGHLRRSCIPTMPNPGPIPELLRSALANAVECALRTAKIERLEDNSASVGWDMGAPGNPDKVH